MGFIDDADELLQQINVRQGIDRLEKVSIVSPAPAGQHRLSNGASRRFVNDRRGLRAFAKWLTRTPVDRVVFEPTGPYHSASEHTLGAAGARQGQSASGASFRRGCRHARQDRSDGATMLARMGALLELQARPPRTEAMLELKELHLAREALVKDCAAAKNRRNALTAPLLKRQNARRLEQIERQMAAIAAAILKQIMPTPISPNGSQSSPAFPASRP